jgi:two-component system response regulator FlrC
MFDDAAMDDQALPAVHAVPAVSVMSALNEALAQAMPVTPEVQTPAFTAAVAAMAPIAMRDASAPVNLGHAVKASEHQVIMAAIQSTDSRMEAAAKLGISPRTLRYKLAQLRTLGMSEGVSA